MRKKSSPDAGAGNGGRTGSAAADPLRLAPPAV
jgi:hypothetical protein